MTNEDFIKSFPQVHAKFLPYIISDHSLAILCVPFNLQEVQTSIDVDPHNHTLRLQEAKLVEDFCKAKSDEEKFLHQQAKIKWLCDGDKKTVDTSTIRKLNPDAANKMISSIYNTEIKRAMFDIDDSKAPGPDGFTATFSNRIGV
nr:hypothetical protein [Tanacetum cinerariifolium]